MSGEYIVEMRGVTKKFPGIVANDDITIGIRKGEIFALLGENGAGKSTLMSMLYGMYEPDGGEIFIRGRSVRMSSPRDAAALGLGMVHQHFKLVGPYTIAENIVLGVEPLKRVWGILPGLDMREAAEKIRGLSVAYGLEVDPDAVIDAVNVSVQQRVEILKMLYRNAEILIFDEPTAVLTPREADFLTDIMRGLREGGHTIILITHKLDEIKRVADRVAVLRGGRLEAILPASASAKEMATLMVGREVKSVSRSGGGNFGGVALEVDNLTVRSAEGFDVVSGVSFSVRSGEIFAIAGVSGNGQIELADAIAGLAEATEGRVILDGRDVTGDCIRRRMESGISYIPEDRQKHGLVLDFTLEENLAARGYYRPPYSKRHMLNRRVFRDRAEDLIKRYDIRSSRGAETLTRSMSGGNQQKAIVAREISMESGLMIFVQPTRGLDIGAIARIREQILAERGKGRAILLISLELDEVMSLADTIGVMYKGRMVKIAPAGISANEIGEYMLGAAS
jgi:simple sugar transport system ATP-binding protein